MLLASTSAPGSPSTTPSIVHAMSQQVVVACTVWLQPLWLLLLLLLEPHLLLLLLLLQEVELLMAWVVAAAG
jgi:hypothetical protein